MEEEKSRQGVQMPRKEVRETETAMGGLQEEACKDWERKGERDQVEGIRDC